MRLLVRLALIGCAAIFFLIFVAYKKTAGNVQTQEEKEADEALRILQSSFVEAQGEISDRSAGTPPLTVNVAIVLVVSLLSVALLITGIIVVAVTMDPSSDDDHDDKQELYKNSDDIESGGECGDFLGEFEAAEKWKKAWSKFNHIASEDELLLSKEKNGAVKNGYYKNGSKNGSSSYSSGYNYGKYGQRPDARRKLSS